MPDPLSDARLAELRSIATELVWPAPAWCRELLNEVDRLKADLEAAEDDVLRAVTERNEVARIAAAEIHPGPDGADDEIRRGLIRGWLDEGRDDAEGWREMFQRAAVGLRVENERLHEELEASEQEIERLKAGIDRLQNELEILRDLLDQLDGERDDLKADLDAAEQEIETRGETIDRLRAAYEPLGDKWGWCMTCDAPWDQAHRSPACRRVPLYLRKADL